MTSITDAWVRPGEGIVPPPPREAVLPPDRSPPAERERWLLATLLLVVGVFFPLSWNGAILVPLGVLHFVLLCVLLGADWLLRQRGVHALRLWNSCLIIVTLVAATLVSPLRELAIGALAPYAAMATLLCMDLRDYRANEGVRRVFIATNVLAVVAGVMVVVAAGPARDLLVRYYSMAYPDLVANMTLWRKPVFTFGSHSVAGFLYYLFFYLNLETYRLDRRRTHLVLAVGNFLLGLFLTSMTAGVLMGIAGVRLLGFGLRRRAAALLLPAAMAAAGLWALRRLGQEVTLLQGLVLAFSVDEGGLRSRYSTDGALIGNLGHVMAHPFRPIGLGFSSTLFYGDSGPLEYLLRGSVLLLCCVYVGLFAFLRANLLLRRHAWHLFVITLIFEVGFTAMTFGRFLYFLPFAVIYLNRFASAPPEEHGGLAVPGA
jgi:hypothetical protein